MDTLPDEIVLNIFQYLNVKSIKNCTKVCERFKDLIYESPLMMSKLALGLNVDNVDAVEKLPMEIPYKVFHINAAQYHHHMTASSFEGKIKAIQNDREEFVEEIQLTDSSSGLATKLLSNLINLTSLTINGIHKAGGIDDEEISVDLPNLKYLKVSNVNSYLKCIRNHKVEVLKVENPYENSTGVSRALNNFLRNAHHLKEFSFSGISPALDVEKFKFKLNKFTFMNATNMVDDLPMIDLIKTQKDHIRELKLTFLVSCEILEFSINEMRLNKLTIDMEKIFKSLSYLKVNRCIKHLEILTLPNNIGHAAKLIANCPAVEVLKIKSVIQHDFNNFFLNISQLMQNLKQLNLFTINQSISTSITFDSLEVLVISKVVNDFQAANVLQFILQCPKLREIKILTWGCDNSPKFNVHDLYDTLKHHKCLQIISIKGNFKINAEIIENIILAKSNLRLLTVDIDIDRNDLTDVDELVSEFHKTNTKCIIPKLISMKMNQNCDSEDENEEDDNSSCASDDDNETLNESEVISINDEDESEIDDTEEDYTEESATSGNEDEEEVTEESCGFGLVISSIQSGEHLKANFLETSSDDDDDNDESLLREIKKPRLE